MSEPKLNNTPWIVLGGICGLVILSLFGFGVYSVIDSVPQITLEIDDSLKPEITDTKFVRLSNAGTYFIDEVNLDSLDALRNYLNEDLSPKTSTQIWIIIDSDVEQQDINRTTELINDMGYYFPGLVTKVEAN